jgi:hypothetical protein
VHGVYVGYNFRYHKANSTLDTNRSAYCALDLHNTIANSMGTGNSNKSKDVLRIKTKTLRGKKSTPCLGELNELFNCLTVSMSS